MAQNANTKSEDISLEPLDQRPNGGGIVSQAASDQCGIVGHSGLSWFTPKRGKGFHP